MRALFHKLYMVIKHGDNADVVLKRHHGTIGCCVVAICRKSDGGVWAIENTVQAAEERQAETGYGREHTYLQWMKLMPSPGLDFSNWRLQPISVKDPS